MRLLLTGGSGFVGRHIVDALGSRYTIAAPRHAELDITDQHALERRLREGKFDAVIHAAVQGGPNVLDTTLRGFWNLHRHAGLTGRILYFGSGAEYAKHRDLIKVREEEIGDVTPGDSYGFAKLICNSLARKSSNILNLRLFGVYGEFEGYLLKFISNAVVKALLGEPIVIRQNVVFDYLWIGDLTAIVPAFLEGRLEHADINVTPTDSVALADIAAIVLTETGRPPSFEIEQSGMNYQYTGSNERLRASIPSVQFTPIAEGVRRLIAYYRARLDTIDRQTVVADEYRRQARTRQIIQPGETRK